MTLVPVFVADLYLKEMPASIKESVSTCGRKVGNGVELDLTLVEKRAGKDWSQLFEAYWEACERFWDKLEEGKKGMPFVRIKRKLGDWQQKTGKVGKADLVEQMSALLSISTIAEIVKVVSDTNIDEEKLQFLSQAMDANIEKDDNKTRLSFATAIDVEWPLALGGNSLRGEVKRHLILDFNHAPWRDRRVRRLSHVEVWAEEIWPAP